MIFQKKTQQIIKSMSLDYYIEEKRVEEVVESQFKFVRDVIVSSEKDNIDTFKIVMLPKFGKFIPNKRMIHYIINNKLKKRNNENSNKESL